MISPLRGPRLERAGCLAEESLDLGDRKQRTTKSATWAKKSAMDEPVQSGNAYAQCDGCFFTTQGKTRNFRFCFLMWHGRGRSGSHMNTASLLLHVREFDRRFGDAEASNRLAHAGDFVDDAPQVLFGKPLCNDQPDVGGNVIDH